MQFVEQLERRGWRTLPDGALSAVLLVDGVSHAIRLGLPAEFPFVPPRVFPTEGTPLSWHAELDGAMCIYPESGRGSLPWLVVDDFIESILGWLRATAAGWPADAPDMDLERYFQPAEVQALVVYDESIESLVDRYVRLSVDGPRIALVGAGVKPKKVRPRSHRLFGYVVDIGVPTSPPRSWPEIAVLLKPPVRENIERSIRRGDIELLLVRYVRGDATGAVALVATMTGHDIELRSIPSASTSAKALALRGGADRDALHSKSVLVVGAGAIGSFVCDQLARSGLGSLTVRDGDVLRPGNSVRHLAPSSLAGHLKADVVKYMIERQPHNGTKIVSDPRPLVDPDEVVDLIASFDLVIDASADGAASAMLADAARSAGVRIVSASLQKDGQIVRVDVIPPMRGVALEAVDVPHRDALPVFEAGCGDPVSMTPPFAVAEVAGLTTRVAVHVLTNEMSIPAGSVHVYG
jgi:hypothetical protein